MTRYWSVIPLLLLLAGCGGGGSGGSVSSDPCGNDIGNGASVISGPSAPDGLNNFDSPFRSLIVHPDDAQILYVGTEENGILRSRDGGASWERLRVGLRHSSTAYPEVYDLAISASNPDILFAATTMGPGLPTGSAAPADGGVYRSEDGGDTWIRKNCGLPNASVSAVYVSPTDPMVALVGLGAGDSTLAGSSTFFPGGVFRTSDGGDNWSRVTLGSLDEQNIFYQLLARGNTDVYSFGLGHDDLDENLGLYRSADNGLSWSPIATPFSNDRIAYFTVSSDGLRIIANELDGFELQVSENGGETWNTSKVVSANGPVRISPHDRDLIVIAANENLWVSDNGLTSANLRASAGDFFQDIEFALSDANTIYAVTRGYHLYRSTDGGMSFQFVIDLRAQVINVMP